MAQSDPPPIIVLYDHSCPLCRREMAKLKARDDDNKLLLVDISGDRDVCSDYGFECADVMAALHVQTAQGEWLIGMPAIRHVYRTLGMGWLVAPTALPLLSPLFDDLYIRFAKHRMKLSRWFGYASRCDETGCRRGQP